MEEDGSVNANGTHVRLAQAFVIAHAALPFVPEWVRTRSDTLQQSVQMHSEATLRQQSLVAVFNSFPTEVQEQLLLEDLLFAMAVRMHIIPPSMFLRASLPADVLVCSNNHSAASVRACKGSGCGRERMRGGTVYLDCEQAFQTARFARSWTVCFPSATTTPTWRALSRSVA